MAASFSHSGGTVTFSRTPHRPAQTFQPVQAQRSTAGDVRFGYSSVRSDRILRLVLRLSSAEKDSLVSFFNTIVKGMVEQFTYNPSLGSALAVHFNTPALSLVEKAGNSWECTTELRVV